MPADVPRGTTRHPFGLALEARDTAAALAELAPDVVLYPPVTSLPFTGREEVGEILRLLLEQELTHLDWVGEARHGDSVAIRFRVEIGGRSIEVVDWLELDDDEHVREYHVYARPIADAAAYLAAIAPQIAGRRGRGRAQAAKLLSWPLPRLLALADKLGNRLAR